MNRSYYSSDSSSTGMSLLGVLQVVFIVLKLCGLIDWTWKVVLIPLWIELGLLAIVCAIVVGESVYRYSKRYRG